MKPKFSALLAMVLVAACAGAGTAEPVVQASSASAAAPVKYDLGQPYLGGPLPAGESLVPPPPAAGSARLALDQEFNRHALSLSGSARWQLAARDADLGTGWFTRAFSCAAGGKISDETTPAIAHLLRRSGTDFGMSTGGVKDIYLRPRPFMENGQPSCTPADEASLRSNGSYPSGHSAIGYGAGLVLAAIFPDRATRLAARGRAFGESRAICNVHWRSDVEEGRIIASASFARLQSDSQFAADLAAARAEARTLDAGWEAASACDSEAAALSEE